MRRFTLFLSLYLLATPFLQVAHSQSGGASPAVTSASSPQPLQQSNDASLRIYIQKAWDTLSRSMSECNSVVDPKVSTTPILYLPAGMPTPPDVTRMQQHCKVDVEYLPKKILHMGDVTASSISRPGLLYLPNRYVVPGGRFNEMYGWDSFFIILGLVDSDRPALAHGMVENFFFEIENYGAILNANRTYYFTRSQPPLLSSMIRTVYEAEARKDPAEAKRWLARAYGYAQRDYSLWSQEPHLAGTTGLARYTDLGAGPVPEMADDSQYYSDVIRWLLAHPETPTSYLLDSVESPNDSEASTLATTSCDIHASAVCAHAYAKGHRLTHDFYAGDRAMRESGFDPSFRFGPFSGSTENYAPVCLNSLLYKYAQDMEHFSLILGKKEDAAKWRGLANRRRVAMNQYLWNAEKGFFYDYDFVSRKQSNYNFITGLYPLWAGVATSQQAMSMVKRLPNYEHQGGLAMSDFNSGLQWDLPFGWAPTNWFAVEGLKANGYQNDSERIATKFNQMVFRSFEKDGTVREKYDVVTGSSLVNIAAGYRSNVVGFGWTNGVYLEMLRIKKLKGPLALH